jgi:hypothetical protein
MMNFKAVYNFSSPTSNNMDYDEDEGNESDLDDVDK